MGPVKIGLPANQEMKDRHLVLFSQCIILLSVSQRLSAFVFEVSFPYILIFKMINTTSFFFVWFFFSLEKTFSIRNNIKYYFHPRRLRDISILI